MKRLLSFLFCLCAAWKLSGAEDRIWIELTIKEKPVRLAFDTGSNFSLLFRNTAEDLQLKLSQPGLARQPVSDLHVNAVTEICDFAFGELSGQIQFLVADLPLLAETEMEGALSWHVFKDNVFEFDPSKGLEISATTPPYALEWPQFKERADSPMLGFDVGGKEARHRIVYVNTGDKGGIALNRRLWEKWVAGRNQQPRTMLSFECMKAGPLIKEEFWADKISIGSLSFTDVPVREFDVKEESGVPDHAATLGLYALRRLHFVYDGRNGLIYARPREGDPPAYIHNRAGAIFAPRENSQDALVAHVAINSPAYRVGIRSGDELLQLNDLDVTNWRADPGIRLRQFWEDMPGTTYQLRLKRGEREYDTTVTLESILGPSGESQIATTLEKLRFKADLGDARAQHELGTIYFFGTAGVVKDTQNAVNWFRKAAEQNYPPAQATLGACYASGTGVDHDDEEATRWFLKAAEQNNAFAQSNLGYRYVRGIGVRKDEVQGVKWLRKASQQNHVEAQINLSICYAHGVGVAKDLVQAYKWKLVAANQGNETAAEDLIALRKEMTPKQILEGQRLAREFRSVIEAGKTGTEGSSEYK